MNTYNDTFVEHIVRRKRGGAELLMKIGVFRADDGHPLALLTENDRPRWFDTAVICADNSAVMSIRRIYDYRSGPIAWTLPSDLIPADGGDPSALDALPCYDETAYTPESYAPYAAALKNAHAVRANRYSAQSVIDAALAAVEEAAAALVETDSGFLRGDFDFDKDMRHMQWGIDAGVDWRFSRRWGVFAELTYGLSGLFKSDFHSVQTLRPLYGTLGIVYRIR
jgi:hypothetical protein